MLMFATREYSQNQNIGTGIVLNKCSVVRLSVRILWFKIKILNFEIIVFRNCFSPLKQHSNPRHPPRNNTVCISLESQIYKVVGIVIKIYFTVIDKISVQIHLMCTTAVEIVPEFRTVVNGYISCYRQPINREVINCNSPELPCPKKYFQQLNWCWSRWCNHHLYMRVVTGLWICSCVGSVTIRNRRPGCGTCPESAIYPTVIIGCFGRSKASIKKMQCPTGKYRTSLKNLFIREGFIWLPFAIAMPIRKKGSFSAQKQEINLRIFLLWESFLYSGQKYLSLSLL